MTRILVDHPSIEQAENRLKGILTDTTFVVRQAKTKSITSSYSRVSGLDRLGANHEKALNGPVNSAYLTAKQLRDDIKWLSLNLRAVTDGLTFQDDAAARGFDRVDQDGGTPGHTTGLSTPLKTYADNVTAMYNFAPIIAPPSLSVLNRRFELTDTTQGIAGHTTWHTLATDLTTIATDLHTVAADLTAHTHGEAFHAGAERIHHVATRSTHFATAAAALAAYTTVMNNAHTFGATIIATANAMHTMLELTQPEKAPAFEQATLAAFPSFFTAALTPAEPGAIPLNTGDVPAASQILNAGINAITTSRGLNSILDHIDLPRQSLNSLAADLARSGDAYGNPDVIAEGLDTFYPYTNTPLTPDAITTTPTTTGITPHALTTGGTPTGLTPGASPTGLTPASTTSLTTGPGLTHGASASSQTPAPTPGLGGVLGSPGATGMNRGTGTTGTANTPHNTTAGPRGAATPPAATATGNTTGTHPNSSSTATRPASVVGPVAGAPAGAGARGRSNQKRSRTNTVTSHVERDGNLKDLLGEPTPVIPQAIGTWVYATTDNT